MKNIITLLFLMNWATTYVNAQTDNCSIIDNYLQKLAKEQNFSGGLLIIKDGKQLLSKGYGWADKANITIHQLLTHSSGFHEFLKDDGGDYEVLKTDAFLKRAFSEPLAFKAGEKAVYTNVGMSVLAIIIEQISGLDYDEFLKKELFAPLPIVSGSAISIKGIGYRFPALSTDTIAVGYQNGKVWGTHQERFAKAGGGPYWNLKGNGGLEAPLNDMFLWANAFTNHTILKQSTIETMFKPHILEEGYNGQSHFGYGCNISKSRRNTKMIDNGGSNGIYFARLIRLPEEGLVFIW